MSDEVVFDPDALRDHGRATDDAVEDVRRLDREVAVALDRVLESGDPHEWGAAGGDPPDVERHRGDLERLGAFTAWLADRAVALDARTDPRGLVHVDVAELGPLEPGVFLDDGWRQVWGARLAASLRGALAMRPDDADWARFQLLASDPTFARALVSGLGGPVGLVDQLLARHGSLAPGLVPGPGDAEDGDGPARSPELERLMQVLGTALGTATLQLDWGTDDTARLVDVLRAEPGDPGFAPGRAAGLAALVAAADQVRPMVVSRLVTTAVEVERRGGGQAAWDRRATGEDTGLWPQPLLDHQGEPTRDVLSTLLLAVVRTPAAGLVAFGSGPSVAGPPGAAGRVDATLAHLLRDHDFDDAGWRRLGAALANSVADHRGRGSAGRAAARVSAQATALAAERIDRAGDLPRPFQPGITALLADAMPSAMSALNGVEPDGRTEASGDAWTFVDADIHPSGEPVQPAMSPSDVRAIVARLGSDPDQVAVLAAASVGTVDLAVRKASEDGRHDDQRLAADAGRSAEATGHILRLAFDGVSARHHDVLRQRALTRTTGTVVGALGRTGAVAGIVVDQFGSIMIHESAVPADYHGAGTDLVEATRDRVLDRMLVDGWFADVPEGAIRRDADGSVSGFDRTHADFEDWQSNGDGGYPEDTLNTIGTEFSIAVGATEPAR